MFKKLLFCFLISMFVLMNSTEVFAYDPDTTHAALTDEIIDFYNSLHSDDQISSEEKEWIVQGSINEDYAVRALNHLYDPVRKIAWNDEHFGNEAIANIAQSRLVAPEEPTTAVDWVNNRLLQSRYGSYGGDRTWKQGLEHWADGNKKEAYITLGHILHLLEDMSVPDHTRNDAHPPGKDSGSPYEDYTKKWDRNNIGGEGFLEKLKRENSTPPQFNSIEGYLESIAQYSNRYFFSKDTINEPNYELRVSADCDSDFCYSTNEKGFRYPLVMVDIIKTENDNRIVKVYSLKDKEEYYPILKAYFSILAPKAILYGAGVVELFRRQVAEEIEFGEKAFPTRIVQVEKGSFVGRFLNSLGVSLSIGGELAKLRNKFVGLINTVAQLPDIFSKPSKPKIIDLTEDLQSQIIETQNEVKSDISVKTPQLAPAELKNQLDDEYDRLSEINERAQPPPPRETSQPVALTSVTQTTSGGGGGGSGGSSSDNIASTSTTATTSNSTATSTASTTSSSTATTSLLLISEIQVEGIDNGDEFIELYNPGTSTVDISGWSIQYVSGGAEISTSTVSKKNFLVTSTIVAQRFFLIARNVNASSTDGYVGTTTADMIHRAFSLSGASAGAKIFLVSNQEEILDINDGDIVDIVDYSFSVPIAGQSLERKALAENSCLSSQGSGEFLGNGCDTGNNSDFEIRSASKPQNSANLPEPRAAPTAIVNLMVGYHFSIPTLVMSWSSSTDYSGSTSTIHYEVQEINSPTSSTPFSFNATSTALEQIIDEIGRNYEFSVKAVDADGLASTSTSASTTVPSFVDNLYLYRDPAASSTDYLVELYYQNYPFVPAAYSSSSGSAWRAIAFYLNKEAEKMTIIQNPRHAQDPNYFIEGMFPLKFKRCNGSVQTSGYVVILPDTSDRCEPTGPKNGDLSFNLLEDNHLLLKLASSTNDVSFSSSTDYLTAAYYDYSSLEGFKLVAVDKVKYSFQDLPPTHNPPSTPANLAVESYTINSLTSTVQISWSSSTDPDSLDRDLSYEFSSDNISWQPLAILIGANPNKLYANVFLGLGSTHNISLRAVDDFNATSTTATTTLTLPAPVIDPVSHSSSTYFDVDGARVENGLLKIKWRLISNPVADGSFGIIPYLTEVGTPANVAGFRALHRDYGGPPSSSPETTANSRSGCSSSLTPLSDYTFGWQYETHFSSVSGQAVSDSLVGEELQFNLYTGATCGIDASAAPIFSGLPVIISD